MTNDTYTGDNACMTGDMSTDECDHDAAQVDHQEKHGTEVVFWIACPDCGGFWTLIGDLSHETASISRDEEDPQ
jgi:hypothetical protein